MKLTNTLHTETKYVNDVKQRFENSEQNAEPLDLAFELKDGIKIF